MKREGCKHCDNAKKALLIITKAGLDNVSVLCTKCDTIWRLSDDG